MRAGWRRLGAGMLGLMLGLSAQAQSIAEENDPVKTSRSVQGWISYVDSIGRLDPQQWIHAAREEQDSLLMDFEDINAQLTKDDWSALLASRETGRLERAAALRIFRGDTLADLSDAGFPVDSAKVTWVLEDVAQSPDGIEMVLVNDDPYDWQSKIYYFQNGCLLGRQDAFHKYGIEGGRMLDFKGITGDYHNYVQESGTGVWQFALLFYTAVEGHLVPMGWMYEAVNLANPCVYNRHLDMTILRTSPLRVRYVWEIELGYRYRSNQPTFQGKTDVTYTWNPALSRLEPDFRTTNLDAEKLLAFDLYAPKELFVHAWNKELLAILKGKNSTRRKAVIEYLDDMANTFSSAPQELHRLD
ncbi:MAG TPA: hypothetical protein VHS96_12475 [Bacteroidia bacterium]|nr:hypothetical protein [Bacteroidia bacterium]